MTDFTPKPFNHPAAWKAAELPSRADWQITLTGSHLAETARLAKDPGASTPLLDQALLGVQDSLEHGSGATLIRGLDTAGLGIETSRELFLALVRRVGAPISQSAEGELVFSVRDEGYGDSDPRTRGPNTRKKLSFHTDRCDVIGFLCLQQAAEGGENEVVSSIAVYNAIAERRPDLLEELMQPYYYKRHNVDTGNTAPYCRQPIFSFHEGHFASAFLRVLIERAHSSPDAPDMTPRQREALDFVEEVAADPELHVRFRQEPGDILFLNNWVTYHRRSEFTDHEAPDLKRHILRIWLSVPNSRPLAPWFRENYGATEAGAIRGGMRPKGAASVAG